MNDLDELESFIGSDPALARIRAEVAQRLDDDPGHDLAHALRVALWTVRLGNPDVDPREAVAAALLHDVVNVPKDSPERARASQRCADHARARLPALGFASDAVGRIADAIRDHSYTRGAVPQTRLGQALQDADRLEALGAIGVMRTISTGVRIGAAYFHPDDPWAASRALDDKAWSVDHFFTKLLRLADGFHTAAGQAEAHRRTDWMRAFLAELGAELARPLPALPGR